MRVISKEEIEDHKTAESCWVIRRGRVFDVTKFLGNHPGGAQLIVDFAGNDINLLMNASDPHTHSKNAYKTLNDMQIGVLEGHEHTAASEMIDKEPVDWDKPMLSQVHILGTDYSRWVHVPVDRWVRLFKNDLMELVSKSPWWLVPMVWIPVIFYNLMQANSLLSQYPSLNVLGSAFTLGPWATPILFVLGFLTWPFIEYFLHRFVFHLEPSGETSWLIRLHFTMHGLHHKAPFDPYHLVFPPAPAALIGVAVYMTYAMVLPDCMINAWFAGTVLGYIGYDLTHYYLHHGHPAPDSYFGRLKKFHIRHHYIDPDHGFGVSSSILDVPFGTEFPNFKCK